MLVFGSVRIRTNTFKLRGKTRKGKNRVHELGELWEEVETREKVSFSENPGPWILIQSCKNKSHNRWIHGKNDPDFEIVERLPC